MRTPFLLVGWSFSGGKGSGKGVERSCSGWLSWLFRLWRAVGLPVPAMVLLAVTLGQIALAQTPKADPFPSLAELKQMLAEAPDLRAVEVEMGRCQVTV